MPKESVKGAVKKVEKLARIAQIGKWAFFIGVIVAILAAFVAVPYLAIVLLVAGLIVGLLSIATAETGEFLIAAIALMLVGAAGLGTIAIVGTYLETILRNLVTFVAPAALVVALKSVLTLARH